MRERYYGYSGEARVRQYLMIGSAGLITIAFVGQLLWVTWLALPSVIAGGETIPSTSLYSADWFVFAIILEGPILMMLIYILTRFLAMYPTITVRENCFRVHSPISKSRWLGWDAIKKARKVELPRRSWMIGVDGLGWLYWPAGFSFWLWMPGIHLTQSIDGYHELMDILKEKRPELFVPYR